MLYYIQIKKKPKIIFIWKTNYTNDLYVTFKGVFLSEKVTTVHIII